MQDKPRPFLPTFGYRPPHILGRDELINSFKAALAEPVGHPDRSTLIIGQRGTGKTTLLIKFEELAAAAGFVPARVTAGEDMLGDILLAIQRNGAQFFPAKKPKVSGFTVGAAGLALGLTFEREVEERLSFRFKLEMLCDALLEKGKGVLLLVDEVQPNSAEIRSLATNYQHLIGANKNIALVMAGLPTSISSVLHDDILTFLNRSNKVYLSPIPLEEIKQGYLIELNQLKKKVTPQQISKMANAARGYPYLYQLIGYYVLMYTGDNQIVEDASIAQALEDARQKMIDNVFAPILSPLSERDMAFLKAMSEDEVDSKVANLESRLNVSKSYVQTYRSRLIDSEIIAAVGHGKLAFTVPYLAEHLRGDF